MKAFFSIVLALVIGVAAIFALNYLGLTNYKFFAPKYQEARREVYEQTPSYVEGKRQEVTKYRLEYMRADSKEEKSALRMTILQTTANLDLSLLPRELESFVHQLSNPF